MSEQGDWTYYSNMVPGYAAKYGNRGMRDRNRLLLDGIKANPEAGADLRVLLAENNLPLAMRVACTYQHLHHTTDAEVWDDYQEACIELVSFTRSAEVLDLTPGQFQVRAYRRMAGVVWGKHKIWIDNERVYFDEAVELIPTDFDAVPDFPDPRADRKALLRLLRLALPQRSAAILELFYFGDGHLIEPGDAELIGWRYGLTRERIWQIVNKSIRHLRRITAHGVGWAGQPENFYTP